MTKCHLDKMSQEKMSQDKMSCRQNVTGKNTLLTKCHSGKMPLKRNATQTKCQKRPFKKFQNKKYHNERDTLKIVDGLFVKLATFYILSTVNERDEF